jgi:hypothetical protein
MRGTGRRPTRRGPRAAQGERETRAGARPSRCLGARTTSAWEPQGARCGRDPDVEGRRDATRRTRACAGARGCSGARPRRHGATRVWPKLFAPIWLFISPDFWTEVHQSVNNKVVDQWPLYNFHKGRQMFWSTVWAGTSSKVRDFHGTWIVFPAVDQVFHHFPLQICNATQKQSCVPRKTGQLLYLGILKCLGEIWRTRQKFRRALKGKGVWRGFWPSFDHQCVLTVLRGSLVIIGEVFEVMTQVDHGFSSRFDSADPAISINDAN